MLFIIYKCYAVSNFVFVNLIVKLKNVMYEIQKQSSNREGSKNTDMVDYLQHLGIKPAKVIRYD